MKTKISHDGKFTIVFNDELSTAYLHTSRNVSVWEIAYTVYVDCVCAPDITIEKKMCAKVRTPSNKLDFEVASDFSINEVLSSICEVVII